MSAGRLSNSSSSTHTLLSTLALRRCHPTVSAALPPPPTLPPMPSPQKRAMAPEAVAAELLPLLLHLPLLRRPPHLRLLLVM